MVLVMMFIIKVAVIIIHLLLYQSRGQLQTPKHKYRQYSFNVAAYNDVSL